MKFARLFLTLLFICLFSPAIADVSYTYGGSGVDQLYEAAASPDGYIVLTGQTDSSDGTLHTRVKQGRSAWALCIDAQGHVRYNFCTHYGMADSLRYPVFHEDGSITMLLNTSHSGLYEVELIRLDAQGDVIDRKILMSEGMPYLVQAYGIHDASPSGYVIRALNKKKSTEQSFLYTYDGEYVGEIPVTDAPLFPEARTMNGETVRITNNDDTPPYDVTVTLAAP